MAVRVTLRRHRVLVAVQQLRDTTHGRQQHVCQLHAARVFVLHDVGDARHVVVAEEGQQFVHVCVHVIERHRVIHACQAVAPA